MAYPTFNAILEFPCGTQKKYEGVTHLKGAKVNGRSPTTAYISKSRGFLPQGIHLVMCPKGYNIFVDDTLVVKK